MGSTFKYFQSKMQSSSATAFTGVNERHTDDHWAPEQWDYINTHRAQHPPSTVNRKTLADYAATLGSHHVQPCWKQGWKPLSLSETRDSCRLCFKQARTVKNCFNLDKLSENYQRTIIRLVKICLFWFFFFFNILWCFLPGYYKNVSFL